MSQDFKNMLNTPDNSSMYDTQDIQDNKIWGALSYLGIPVLGSVLSALISLLLLAYTLFGIITAGSGKAKELPFIGGLMHVFDK